MKRVCIIQARMGSSRLPGKILMEISGKPMLQHIIERVRGCKNVDEIVVATTKDVKDRKVVELCEKIKCKYFEGLEEDVLDRYYQTAMKFKAEVIVRVTADCPLVDPHQIDAMIELQSRTGADYVENLDVGLPLGIGAEVITLNALEKSWKEGDLPHHREHVNEYILENRQKFRTEKLLADGWIKRNYRLTVDAIEDLTLIREIYKRLYKKNTIVDLKEAIEILDNNPVLLEINKNIKQKAIK